MFVEHWGGAPGDLGLLFVAGEAAAALELAGKIEASLAVEAEDDGGDFFVCVELSDLLDQVIFFVVVEEWDAPFAGAHEAHWRVAHHVGPLAVGLQ